MKRTTHSVSSSKVRLSAVDLQPIMGLARVIRLSAADLHELILQAHASNDLAHTCMQMFHVFTVLGQRDFALELQATALAQRVHYRIAGPSVPKIRLLAMMAPGDMLDNTPIEFIVDSSDIRLDVLYLLPGQELPDLIPDHDLVMVAIGDSDKNKPLLLGLDNWLTNWPRSVLNQPMKIRNCAREMVYQLLHDIPGLLVPVTRRLNSEQVHHAAFPFTIRPVDTQGGTGLMKIDNLQALAAFLDIYPGPEYHVSDYIDYKSDDGRFRKFRIVLIDGHPYLCHLAISESWMVHYQSAGMDIDAEKRAEEERAMANFDSDFATRHRSALAAISSRLGLDYVVLDCSESHDGRLLLFPPVPE